MKAKQTAAVSTLLAAGLTLSPAAAFAAEAQGLPLECSVVQDSWQIFESRDFTAVDSKIGTLAIGDTVQCGSVASGAQGEVRELITEEGTHGWTLSAMLVELVTYPADAYSENAFVVPSGGVISTKLRLYAQPSRSSDVLAQLSEGEQLTIVPGELIEDSAASITGTTVFVPARTADGRSGFVPEDIVASAPSGEAQEEDAAHPNDGSEPGEKAESEPGKPTTPKTTATPPDHTAAALAAAKAYPELPATFAILGFILGIAAAIGTGRVVKKVSVRRGGVAIPDVDEVDERSAK